MQPKPVNSPTEHHRLKPALAFGLIFLFGLIVACGHKALPVLPDMHKPMAVEGLTKEIVNGRLVLSWQVAAAENRSALDRFVVYRSKVKLNPTLCKTCPLPFDKVATLDFDEAKSGSLKYQETLDQGYWYSFKVVPINVADTPGPETTPVKFEY